MLKFDGVAHGTWWVSHNQSIVAALTFTMTGPCTIDMTGKSSNGTLFNPYAWNSNLNLFFLDQP